METTAKTDSFLEAIKKHALEKQELMRNEISEMKAAAIKNAEKKAKSDSDKLIREKLEEQRNKQRSIIAKKSQQAQKELFIKRLEMTDTVFEKAKAKLIEFTNTLEYNEKLINSAKEISELFGDESCTIYINEKDMDKADSIKAIFINAEITTDNSIVIGGIKGFCPAMNIVADETIDTKLYAQKDWFIENSGLKVF